jgi:hypothetical protein
MVEETNKLCGISFIGVLRLGIRISMHEGRELKHLDHSMEVVLKNGYLARRHSVNPSYLGGRDQEDQSQPRQIVPEVLAQKNPPQKKGW